MAKFTIIIKGISLIYQKNGLWKAIFPFGGCHYVNFSVKDLIPNIRLAVPNTQIRITSRNASSDTDAGSSFNQFLDLTNASYSHEKIMVKNNWPEHSALMSIENAVFSVYETTHSKYC